MKPYSNDLRNNIIKAYKSGRGSTRDLAFDFGVSLSFITDLMRRYRNTGSVAPKQFKPGPKPMIEPELYPVLQNIVENDNDATIQEYCDQFDQQTGIRVSKTNMGKLLRKLGFKRKKKTSTQQNKILPVFKRYERRISRSSKTS